MGFRRNSGRRYIGGVSVVLFCSGVFAVASAEESSYKHRLKFDTDSEFIYTFSSTLKQEIRTPGLPDVACSVVLTAVVSQVVVDVSRWRGIALCGFTGKGRLAIFEGRDRVPQAEKDQSWLCAFRANRLGESVQRKAAELPVTERFRRRGVNQFGEMSQICAGFPRHALGVGDKWEGEAVLPMPWGRQPASAVSRLSRIYRDGGRPISVVVSSVRCKRVAAPGYRWNVVTPHLEIKGTTEGHFDVERGLWTYMKWNVMTTLTGRGERGFEGKMALTSSTKLNSVKPVQKEKAGNKRRLFRILDAALGELHRNRITKGLGILEKYEKRETDPSGRGALRNTLTALKVLRRPAEAIGEPAGPGGEQDGTGPDYKLMDEIDQAVTEKRWQEALKKYESLPAKYPESRLVPEALASAAQIYEEQLGDRNKALELRGRLIGILEGEARKSGDPLAQYRLASAYVGAGDLEKASTAYRRVVKSAEGEVPAGIRLLAQYRMAVTYDRMGEREQAIKAYEAVGPMQAGDVYARNVKRAANVRLQELGRRGAQ